MINSPVLSISRYVSATKNDPTSGSPIRAAYMYPSIYLGLYPDGRVGPGKDGSLSNTLAALLEGGEKKTVSNTMTGKFSLSYKPIKDLTPYCQSDSYRRNCFDQGE